jgi:hypothetical protein
MDGSRHLIEGIHRRFLWQVLEDSPIVPLLVGVAADETVALAMEAAWARPDTIAERRDATTAAVRIEEAAALEEAEDAALENGRKGGCVNPAGRAPSDQGAPVVAARVAAVPGGRIAAWAGVRAPERRKARPPSLRGVGSHSIPSPGVRCSGASFPVTGTRQRWRRSMSSWFELR